MDAAPREDLFKLDSFSTDGHACRWLAKKPMTDVSWTSGEPITAALPELRYTLEPILPQDDHGPTMPDFFKVSVPLVSRAFVDALRAAGVTSFQTFPAIVHDPITCQDLATHVAINVLGTVPHKEWCVDSKAIGGRQMFRLAEWEEWIVTDALRGALSRSIHTLRFRSLRDCAGRD